MDLISGILFMSLEYVRLLLPVLFFVSILYHFVTNGRFEIVFRKGMAFLIASAMIVGIPVGVIKSAYPEAHLEKVFVKEMDEQ